MIIASKQILDRNPDPPKKKSAMDWKATFNEAWKTVATPLSDIAEHPKRIHAPAPCFADSTINL